MLVYSMLILLLLPKKVIKFYNNAVVRPGLSLNGQLFVLHSVLNNIRFIWSDVLIIFPYSDSIDLQIYLIREHESRLLEPIIQLLCGEFNENSTLFIVSVFLANNCVSDYIIFAKNEEWETLFVWWTDVVALHLTLFCVFLPKI